MPNPIIYRRLVNSKLSISNILGTRFNDTFNDLTGYTITNPNSTWSASGGQLTTNNGTGTTGFGNFAYYTAYKTSLVKWDAVIEYTLPSMTATTNGLALGVRDLNTSSATQNDTYVHFVTNTGANQGKLLFYTVGILRQTSASSLAINDGDLIKFTLDRSEFTLTATVENITTGQSYSDSYTSPSTGTSGTLHQMGSFAIWNEGGSYTVDYHKVSSQESKNVRVCFVGDSITMGYDASTLANTFRETVEATGITTACVAAPANGTSELKDSIADAVEINADYYVLMIGGNNASFGDWDATRQGYYNDIVTSLSAVGTVIHLTPTARDAVNVSSVASWIEANHSSDTIIKTYEATKDLGATTFRDEWDFDDGTHPGDAGHKAIYNQLKLFAPAIFRTDQRTLNANSVLLDGTNEFIQYGDILDTVFPGASKQFTISIWAKRSATGVNDTILSKFETTGDERAFAMQFLSANTWRWIMYESGTTANSLSYATTTTYADTNWHHILMTYDQTQANADKIKVWIDGTSEALTLTTTGTFNDIYDGTAQLVLGTLFVGGSASNSFGGNLTEFAVYDAAFNGTEASEMYNSGTPLAADSHSQSANLVLYTQLGENAIRDDADTNWYFVDRSASRLDGESQNMENTDVTTTTV